MIQLNYRDSRPIYEQIRDQLQRLIVSGAMAEGEKLPSVRELAAALSINPNTIQRAYRELENQGYITSVAGKGSFVGLNPDTASALRQELLARLRDTASELRMLGMSREELKAVMDTVQLRQDADKEGDAHD